jgi:hypothetical protein
VSAEIRAAVDSQMDQDEITHFLGLSTSPLGEAASGRFFGRSREQAA